MYPKWLWSSFSLPGVVWLVLLFLVPMYAVTGVASGGVDPILQTPIPAWNPRSWNVVWVGQGLHETPPGGIDGAAGVLTVGDGGSARGVG